MAQERIATLSLQAVSGIRATVRIELAKGLSKEISFVLPTEEECRARARAWARQHGASIFRDLGHREARP